MNLPSILVTDTNIWIDLQSGNILVETFHLPYQFVTPDFAQAEFISPSWNRLQDLGLIFQALDGESVLELIHLRQAHLQLSIVDLSALLLAKALQTGLVTGDRRLKALALAQGLPVHGVLWILDEMVLHQILASSRAADALLMMLSYGARLPQVECQQRLERWG